MLDEIELGGEFFEGLMAMDLAIVMKATAESCRYCGGRLHRGDYPRKPRGGLIGRAAVHVLFENLQSGQVSQSQVLVTIGAATPGVGARLRSAVYGPGMYRDHAALLPS